jgi:hypothetical protein
MRNSENNLNNNLSEMDDENKELIEAMQYAF